MNLLPLAGFGAVGAVLLYVFVDQKPADVYEMPVSNAYGLLSTATLTEDGKGPYGRLDTSVAGNGSNQIYWSGSGAHASRKCTLQLQPFEGDAARTHVTVDCKGGSMSDGAAAGMAHNMHRNQVIELVDATLTGRAYDPSNVGEIASRWPGDGVDGSLGTAMGNAIEMDREMRSMQAEAEGIERERAAEAATDDYYASDDY